MKYNNLTYYHYHYHYHYQYQFLYIIDISIPYSSAKLKYILIGDVRSNTIVCDYPGSVLVNVSSTLFIPIPIIILNKLLSLLPTTHHLN